VTSVSSEIVKVLLLPTADDLDNRCCPCCWVALSTSHGAMPFADPWGRLKQIGVDSDLRELLKEAFSVANQKGHLLIEDGLSPLWP
jgi:hypothetical protein